MHSTLRIFMGSFVITAIALVIAFIYGGPAALLTAIILGIIETSLSFDNAIVNARILERMSEFWVKMFLTVGIVIAVFGMRIVFPILLVSFAAQLNPVEAVQLALAKGDPETPGTYGYVLAAAHPQIAGFGGMFLLMLFLDFFFEKRDINWIPGVERFLGAFGERINGASFIVGLAFLFAAGMLDPTHREIVLVSGILGMGTYLLVNALGSAFESDEGEDGEVKIPGKQTKFAKATGKAGFFLFLYLEVLDASFSFDGVIGALAITVDPIIIALGLGLIGAMFVRSLTVYFVRTQKLKTFVYLEHGAHWAIGGLAMILLLTISFHINELVTGSISIVFILAALISSIIRKKREDREALERGEDPEDSRTTADDVSSDTVGAEAGTASATSVASPVAGSTDNRS
jgi:hypothetical protein